MKKEEYDFNKEIVLTEFHQPRFDIAFYSFLFTLFVSAVLFLLFIHDGRFKIDFVLWRVLLAMPLIILAYWIREMLEELRIYPQKLLKKKVWTIEEMMELSGKDRNETEKIMSRVLDACFKVQKQ